MRRESCHCKTSGVTWDSEEVVAEQYSSFHPNVRSFEELTIGFQLCVCVQHLWPLITCLGLLSCRKAYRAWHIQEKLPCKKIFSRSTFTLWIRSRFKQMQRQVEAGELGTDL